MKTLLDLPELAVTTERDPVIWSAQGTDLQRRVILICPHMQFSMVFGDYLKKVDPNVDIDEVSDAALPDTPYVDVRKREEGRKFPTYIIDFLSLNKGDEMVKFPGYAEWALEKYRSGIKDHMYFMTNGLVDQAIEFQAKMKGGTLGKYGFDITAFLDDMQHDARILLGGDLSQLKLLNNVIGGLESLVDRTIKGWKESED